MGYIFLILTIVCESAAVICMKLSNGFHHKLYGGISIVAYILTFVFLTLSLRQLPVGLANAIWAGASSVLVVLLGILIFKETISGWQIVFLSLIIIGLVGLQLAESK